MSEIPTGPVSAEIKDIKGILINLCDRLNTLNQRGIKVEFSIADNKLIAFRAWQEMSFHD